MNPLVAKEIRLLLPAYAMALLLAIVPAWLLRIFTPIINSNDIVLALYLFGFGVVMLALSSFGREFGLKTFPLILAQPIERKRIWKTKVLLLASAMASVYVAWFLVFAAHMDVGTDWRVQDTMAIGATIAAASFAGALWTTLLLRQVVAAFWFTILIPGAILMIVDVSHGTPIMMFAAMIIYSIVGFWLAWWQFSHAQEAAWTGGVISFPGWRSANAGTQSSVRTRRPIAALFWKELQMQQVGLLGMAGLFALHLGVVWLRKAGHFAIGDTTRTALEVFGGLWFIVPVLTGCLSVSEERKLGTMQELLCLPISRRIQFFIKLVVTLVLGGLLSALLLWTAEGIGGMMGAGADIAGLKIPFDCGSLTVLSLGFLGLSIIGFYASTLTRGIVQALAAAVAVTMVVWLFMMMLVNPQSIGTVLWRGFVALYIALPTLLGTFVWLAWWNFRSSATDWFLWRRNLLGVSATLVFIVATPAAIYNRAWELLTPLEPAHGPARLTGPKPVTLKSYGGSALTALLPDGRLWVDRIAYDPGKLLLDFQQQDHGQYADDENPKGIRVGGGWLSLSGNQIADGSNWVDAVTTYRETVGIRADGTLWVSKKPRQPRKIGYDNMPGVEKVPPSPEAPAGLVRFGDGTDWQSVVADYARSVMLLKRDGTLWRWGNNYEDSDNEWPGLRAFQPYRLGKESDWSRIISMHRIYAWKKDGQAWVFHYQKPGKEEIFLEPGRVMERVESFDNITWRSMAECWPYQGAVRNDGTLWARSTQLPLGEKNGDGIWEWPMVQVGKDRDWTAVAGNYQRLVALKTDGSIWEWKWNYNDIVWYAKGARRPEVWLAKNAATRLSTHNDWVGVGTGGDGGVVSLAADGSLWYWWNQSQWQDPGGADQPMLAPSRKPSKIENIFAREK